MSTLGHGFVLISLLIFFFVVVEAKFVGEPFLFYERNSLGVPYFANRLSSYNILIIQLRQPSFFLKKNFKKSDGFLFNLINSSKTILLMSTSLFIFVGLGSTLMPVSLFISGAANLVGSYNYLFNIVSLGVTFEDGGNLTYGSFSIPGYWDFSFLEEGSAFLSEYFLLATPGAALVLLHSISDLTKSLFFFLVILVVIFYFFSVNSLTRSFVRLYGFLKNTVTTNLPFLNFLDLVVIFIFFFMSVYFLEVHFFFIFLFSGASESSNYQFNFLLSSFFFVFLVKTLGGIYSQSLLFSVSSFNQAFFNFYSGVFFKVNFKNVATKARGSYKRKQDFEGFSSFIIYFFLNSFFFLSTFLVWFLRFCIQFVRLLVLFIVHTVFEFIVIGSDFYFSSVNSIDFFIFKSFFLFFFYFCGFLYLIVYLNLMFTLQIFIFYFFSEVFQSNFLFDLSAISISKLKK